MCNYQGFADEVKRLDRAVAALEPVAGYVGVEPPQGQEWFELLRGKLLPQLDLPPLLVVGIVGGTNIGKSVLFNHLADEVASAVSPLAAGTKHPVCMVHPDAGDETLLGRLFESFELRAWQSADDPLQESPEDLLFWRVGSQMPRRLALLDAPDVDSDVTVNWERARSIRRAADVLVAVLTQQKYNDAAVKQFFRAAVEADKPIVAVFNQCHPTDDREFWPQWLATFCEETGAAPELVYVVPYDRAASEQLRLPFYSVGRDGHDPPEQPTDLRDELASLHFDAIKIRTFRGALARVLDRQRGVGAYLESIRRASGDFSAAAEALSATEMARVAWPTLPAAALVEEIRNWWHAGRGDWSRRIHGFYRVLGRGVTWPVRAAYGAMAGPGEDPLATFQQQEREAVVSAVGRMFDELGRLARVGNDTLRPRLMRLLGGDARTQLIERVEAAHGQLPAVDDDYREFLTTELNAWRESSPRAVRLLQSLDYAWAVARPTITVALVVSSWGLAGGLVGHAGHAASELATEAAITGGIAGGGEAIVSTTSEGMRQAATRLFTRLQSRYAEQRAGWLASWLERELLGDLLADLRRGAEVPESEAFREVQAAVDHITDLQ
ncbi:MAG: 50S ribosome-binding GTPase [Candidatus Nealsonbacteria bacterium]|nr:50S ribosome-binding GTPase [Candidatus Nealsonbacteria bacterium]